MMSNKYKFGDQDKLYFVSFAGFVEQPEDYLYSSARDYYGIKGLIDILLVGPLLV
jgi:hypothetical protein